MFPDVKQSPRREDVGRSARDIWPFQKRLKAILQTTFADSLLRFARFLPNQTLINILVAKLRSESPAASQATLASLFNQIAYSAQSNSGPWQALATAARQLGEWGYLSFSQSGEDSILYHYLRNQPNGFYVDVGANHPIRFSNTYLFYLLGWNGINIEPTTGTKLLFDDYRPRDTNLEVAVGNAEIDTLFIFAETCFNTMNQALAAQIIANGTSRLISQQHIKKIPLQEILALYAEKTTIDFLTVDAEGMDEEVLASNNWDRYRPRFVVAERHAADPVRTMNPGRILESAGYTIAAQTPFSVIYRDGRTM